MRTPIFALVLAGVSAACAAQPATPTGQTRAISTEACAEDVRRACPAAATAEDRVRCLRTLEERNALSAACKAARAALRGEVERQGEKR
jgi:hypothetical protein